MSRLSDAQWNQSCYCWLLLLNVIVEDNAAIIHRQFIWNKLELVGVLI